MGRKLVKLSILQCKGLVSRDYSLLVFIQKKAGGGQSNKRYGYGAKTWIWWIWQFTSTALYPATLKGQCH